MPLCDVVINKQNEQIVKNLALYLSFEIKSRLKSIDRIEFDLFLNMSMNVGRFRYQEDLYVSVCARIETFIAEEMFSIDEARRGY